MTDRVGNLEVDELLALLRDELRALAREAVHEVMGETQSDRVTFPPPIPDSLRDQPLQFPVDDVGPWPDNLSLRREDIYDDDRQ